MARLRQYRWKGADQGMLIHANLEKFALSRPEQLCLVRGQVKLTYKELACHTDQLASRLASIVDRGERVVIKLADPIGQLCFFLAVAKAGAASVLVDPAMSAGDTDDLLHRTGARICIDAGYCLPDRAAQTLPHVHPEDIFLVAMSSGSTGAPKLIERDHQSWVRAFPVQSEVFSLSGDDRLFLTGSMVYTANLNSLLHLLYTGGTVVLAGNDWPRGWLKEITLHKITSIFMVPANYRLLLKILESPLDRITALVSGGAKMDPDTLRSMKDYFPGARICEYYGASELGHVSWATAGDLLKYPGTVGKAFPGVKFWTEDNLIWVESPYLAPQYRPRATVGDLGEINADGFLFVQGRQNDMINMAGVKIVPAQIEKILNLCPGLTESAVMGVPDPLRGQKVVAWVVSSNPDLTLKQIKAFCREHLPRHSRPQEFIFLEEMPRNTSGKLDRRGLMEKYGG
ncbi:MAG: class I adenylate-forming enzyme family protein [Bacillota bacterium]